MIILNDLDVTACDVCGDPLVADVDEVTVCQAGHGTVCADSTCHLILHDGLCPAEDYLDDQDMEDVRSVVYG